MRFGHSHLPDGKGRARSVGRSRSGSRLRRPLAGHHFIHSRPEAVTIALIPRNSVAAAAPVLVEHPIGPRGIYSLANREQFSVQIDAESAFRDFSVDATFPCAREPTFFCARTRTTDVGAREMPGSVVTAEQVCKDGKFAKRIARFANLDSTQVHDTQ